MYAPVNWSHSHRPVEGHGRQIMIFGRDMKMNTHSINLEKLLNRKLKMGELVLEITHFTNLWKKAK